MSNALSALAEAGVSVWLDDLSRPLIESGSLGKLVNDGEIVGITTNPTIFAKGSVLDPAMRNSFETSHCKAQPSAKHRGS